MTKTEPMKVLDECIEVMKKKADDYQNGNSTVKQADYYPHGIQSLYDMVNTKRLRVKSLMDKQLAGGEPNHESLEDSLKDLINYAAFSVAWMRGKIEGQDPTLDSFNRPKESRVFSVDVGKMTAKQAEDYIKNTMDAYKDKQVYADASDYVMHNPLER